MGGVPLATLFPQQFLASWAGGAAVHRAGHARSNPNVIRGHMTHHGAHVERPPHDPLSSPAINRYPAPSRPFFDFAGVPVTGRMRS